MAAAESPEKKNGKDGSDSKSSKNKKKNNKGTTIGNNDVIMEDVAAESED